MSRYPARPQPRPAFRLRDTESGTARATRPGGPLTVSRAYPPGPALPTKCATTRTLSRVRVFTRDAGPRTVTDTRSGNNRKPVKPEAAVVIGTPPIERSMIAVTSPAMRTVLGEIRTTPRGVVSIGTVWKKGPLTLEITVGSVVTESNLARLCSGPTRWARLGVIERPRSTKPDSASTFTRGTIRTSLRDTESSRISTSRGRISTTCTSIPLGSSTSAACSWIRHSEAENVSGMTLRITRGKERSLRISLPFPAITTVTPAVCWRTVRPGGMPMASRMAKLCDRGCCAATATYNMMAKNTAASLIGQLRTISCPRLARTVIDQPPDQNFVHGTVPLRRADHFLDDHPVAIDHPAFGHAGRLVGRLDRPRLVVQNVEAEPQLTRESHDDGIVLLVDAHSHHPEVATRSEAAVQPLHRRHFHAARLAPGRPHVEQHDLAAVVGEGGGAPGPQVCRVKPGCCGAHPQQIDLRPDLERERRAEHQRHHDADRDRPLPRCRHTVTRQRRRRSRTSRAWSPLVKIAWPATNVPAPAAWAVAMV